MNSQSWSIIIFCYNEEGSIAQVIENAYDVTQKIAPEKSEIIIVNDGSSDGTKEQAEKLSRKYSTIKIINHPHNRGIGEALRSGYFNARNENVCAVPADGQFDLDELLPYAETPPKTFVSFHRIVKSEYSSYRTFLSLMNRKINHYFLGLKTKDVNWVKIYKLDELKNIDIQMHSSLIETEICAKLLIKSNTLLEVSSSYKPRLAGKVKGSSPKEVLKIGKELYKLIKIVRQFKNNVRTKKMGLLLKS